MSKEQHTSEPWKMPGGPSRVSDIFEDGDYEITPPLGEAGPVAIVAGEANARRIVACVNALQGIGTETLERFVAGVLRKKFGVHRYADMERQITRLRGALEKAKEFLFDRYTNAEGWDIPEAEQLHNEIDAALTTEGADGQATGEKP